MKKLFFVFDTQMATPVKSALGLFVSSIAIPVALATTLAGCTKAETNKFLSPEVDVTPLAFEGFASVFSCRGKLEDGSMVFVSRQAPTRPELGTLESDSLLVVETRKLAGDTGGYRSSGKLVYFGKISNFEIRASNQASLEAEVAKSGAVTLTHYTKLSQVVVSFSANENFGLDCKNKTATYTK